MRDSLTPGHTGEARRSMELIGSTIQSLVRFWKLCVTCAGRCRAPRLSRAVYPQERLTRFIFQNSEVMPSTGRPRPKAFYPTEFKGELETSIGRLSAASAVRIRHLGRYIRYPTKAIGRTVVPLDAIIEAGLVVEA